MGGLERGTLAKADNVLCIRAFLGVNISPALAGYYETRSRNIRYDPA
jgi:hypothetical protein